MCNAIDHILLLDDEEDCNFVTRMVLKRSGFQGRITCHTSAWAAFEQLESGADIPELMFVDINMPGMTGFQFLARCESAGLLPNGRTSVVMFSSSNRTCDMEEARRFRSVIGYVEKALTTESYERMLHLHASRSSSAEPTQP